MNLHIGGRRSRISTKESIHPDDWSTAKGRPKPSAEFADSLTTLLDRMEHRAREVHLRLKAEFVPITLDSVKQAIQRDIDLGGKQETFVDFIDRHIRDMEQYRPDGSLEVYRSVLKLLRGYTGPKDFNDITPDWFRKYQQYMERVKVSESQVGYSLNYIGKNVGVIRELMTVALNKGLHRNVKYKSQEYIKPKEEVDTVYLKNDELMAIYRLQNLTPGERRVRDRFLIQAFTCLRFSDSSKITKDSVRDGMIHDRNIKTGESVMVPLHWVVEEIMAANPDGLPPAISNVQTNKHLKSIAFKAGINDPVEVTKTIGGKVVRETVPKWQMVTTHTGRRSAATNMILAGIPKSIVKGLGAWKTDESFDRYIRASKLDFAMTVKDDNFFKRPEPSAAESSSNLPGGPGA